MADQRFDALSRDPRYRLPSKKEKRTAVDPRFGRLFTDSGFRKKASVDRYGRKVNSEEGTKELERLYRLEKDGPSGKGEKVERELLGTADSSSESDEGEDEDEELVGKKDPARDGFSESSSEEEGTSDGEDSEVEAELAEETAGGEQTEDIPEGEVSHRLAAVNLDWDNIRATDIMTVAASFVPSGGRIERVTIYPSEFGRERLEREELEGPPRDIFASSKMQKKSVVEEAEEDSKASDDEDEDEKIKQQLLQSQANDGDEFDTTALRQYQLERLRYYYAVIECDARKEVQKRAFSRAEIEDNDMQAYIGSDDSDADSMTSRKSAAEDRKAKKKAEQRQLMREKLGLGSEPAAKSKGRKEEPVGDMQVTFTSGLSKAKDGKDGVFENEPQDAESTRERYIRKERDRKQKRKDRSKASRLGDAIAHDDDNDNGEAGAEVTVAESAPAEDAGFDDPFFQDPGSAAVVEKKAKKAERQKKREAKAAKEEEDAARRKELELLMADDQADNVRHFDMREVAKAEKEAKRKGKKGGNKSKPENPGSEGMADGNGDGVVAAKFNVDSRDPRFKALFESHEYAIDPTNPRFKGTEGMKSLLEEGRKKRKRGGDEEDETERPQKAKSKKGKGESGTKGDDDLKGLVARLIGRKA
ncbi:pre-rRNA-processing protein esf1 [Friedmanniomyces endolithicus]|nr:pre-rRNA-processing protein esf1 [Friedmanniomyces endolithicus]